MKKHFQSGKTTRETTGGFTLIEMVVASTLFITALVLMVGALLSMEVASRKARNTRVAMDNVGAALDSMSRNLRMGTSYHCGSYGFTSPIEVPKDCEMNSVGGNFQTSIAFERQGGAKGVPGDQYVYRLQGTRIERSIDGGASWVALTAPEIVISNLRFWVGGVTVGADQPYIIMLVEGTVGTVTKTQTTFSIQTTISQRTPNLF
jgi:type II secretory pathway component PulJ